MDGRPTWTDCDKAGDYVVPNVLSPRDLVFRPDNMDETVPHTHYILVHYRRMLKLNAYCTSHKIIRIIYRPVPKGQTCVLVT